MATKDDTLEFEGEVISSCKSKFVVKVNDAYSILTSLGGKLRKSDIRILVGDFVRVQVSSYDPSIGRIVYRMKV